MGRRAPSGGTGSVDKGDGAETGDGENQETLDLRAGFVICCMVWVKSAKLIDLTSQSGEIIFPPLHCREKARGQFAKYFGSQNSLCTQCCPYMSGYQFFCTLHSDVQNKHSVLLLMTDPVFPRGPHPSARDTNNVLNHTDASILVEIQDALSTYSRLIL